MKKYILCSVPLSSEEEDRGMLKEQELADEQRDQDMQMDTEGLQDMPMEVQGVQDTTMNVQEMSDGLQYMQGVSRQLMDKPVAGASTETVLEDMQGMQVSMSMKTRQPVEGTSNVGRIVASRIVELERRRASPGSSSRKPRRNKKEVLDLSNCQRIDDFMMAMGGRKHKRKANGEIEEHVCMKKMRPPGK